MGVTGWGGSITLYVEADFSEAVSNIGTSAPTTLDTIWDTDYWDDPTALWESTETLSWTDITEWVQGINTSHGFARQTNRYNCATAGVRLNNLDGRFSPTNVNSPYRIGDSSTIGPLRPFRIRANWTSDYASKDFTLFTGIIQAWNLAYDYNGNAIVDVELLGSETLMASTELPAESSQGAGETSGARINRILTAANWQGTRYVDDGEATVQATTLEGNVLSQLQTVADSEGGAIWWDSDGTARFDAFNAQIDKNRTSSHFFFSDIDDDTWNFYPGDPVAEIIQRISFQTLNFAYDGDLVKNIYNWQREGGTVQTLDNQSSRALFGDRGDSRSDLICTTDDDVLRLIDREIALNVTPELRVESIKFSPLNPRNADDTGNPGARVWLWLAYGLMELRQGTFVYFKPPGEPDWVRSDVFIESISHDISTTGWEITLGFSSATVYVRMANSLWDTGYWDTAVWSW